MKRITAIILAMTLLLGAVGLTGLYAAAAGGSYSAGDTFEYGTYPQSRVTDEETVAALNAQVKDSDWQSYGYYSGNCSNMNAGYWFRTASDSGKVYSICQGVGDITDSQFSIDNYTDKVGGVLPAIRLSLPSGTNAGDIIEFGSYPQTHVADDATLSELSAIELEWKSYDYYYEGAQTDKMLYADAECDGVKYRAVIYDEYVREVSNLTKSIFEKGKVHWFRWDPIQWRVLDTATGLLISEKMIDAQPFGQIAATDGGVSWGDSEKTYYASSYENSDIRAWLTGDAFFGSAFSTDEQASLLATDLTDCSVMGDKVFLLSKEDGENTAYFPTARDRNFDWTDYNFIQGWGLGEGSYYTDDIYAEFGEQTDNMKYADVALNGEKYRGVAIDEYRTNYNDILPRYPWIAQPVSGYYRNSVYWFKYEPLTWRVLDPAQGLVISENVIDSQPFTDHFGDLWWGWINKEQKQYSVDWNYCSLRAWMNDTFYNDAFNEEQQGNIATTTLDLSGKSPYEDDDGNIIEFENTQDKLFILTKELSDYGLDSANVNGSDYAYSQGLTPVGYLDREANRTPWWAYRVVNDAYTAGVAQLGIAMSSPNSTDNSAVGARPVMCLDEIKDDPSGAETTCEVTFVAEGTEVQTVNYTLGETSITEPAVPEKTGNTGEWEEYTLGDSHLTVNAVYTLKEYKATFVADGTKVDEVPFTVETISITEPAVPEKTGYTGKWDDFTLGASDITINAVYTPIEYKATFVADGTKVDEVPFTVETTSITEPAVPEKTGYTGAWESYTLGVSDITINAIYTGNVNIEIKGAGDEITTGYKADKIFEAVASDIPEGAEIHWFVNGEDVGTGEKYKVEDPTDDYTVQAKVIDRDGNVLAESSVQKVKVKNGFFDRLKYFFTEIFMNILLGIFKSFGC